MIYRRFYILIVVQVFLLVASIFLCSFAIQKYHFSLIPLNLVVLVFAQVVYLIHYINKVNNILMNFFDAFKFQDTSIRFLHRKHEKQFKPLYQKFDRIFTELRELRAVQEKERFFYMNILDHIEIGLLAFDESGTVSYYNKAVSQYCRTRKLQHIVQLNSLNQGFSELITKMKPNHKEMLKVVALDEVVQFAIRCSEIKLENVRLRIISFQDIRYEIEQKEVEAWQKLIRVIIHEIMNSVSPVAFTTTGLINLLEQDDKAKDQSEIRNSDIENLLTGLKAIRNRNKGLGNFVENYRNMNRFPQPEFLVFNVNRLLERLKLLMQEACSREQIEVSISVIPESLSLKADEKLIEQILLNLIYNSIYALKDATNKWIRISAKAKNSGVHISVADNGNGLSPEQLDAIFVPFFTTKKDGSGIGLSVSREIMKLHGGFINVRSEPCVETVFTLVF